MSKLPMVWRIRREIAYGPTLKFFEHVGDLMSANIGAVVHLVEVAPPISRCLKTAEIASLLLPVGLADDETVIIPPPQDLQSVADFIRHTLVAARPVYVHCDTGELRSPYIVDLLAERFLWPLGQ